MKGPMMKWIPLAFLMVVAPMPAQASPWAPSDGARLEFDVLRDGGQFGTHILKFDRDGDTLTVETDVELRVSLGPITLFEHLHDVTEKYAGDRLVWIGSRTKTGGKWKTLSVEAVEGGFNVKGEKFKGLLASPIIPSTHWNEDQMRQGFLFSTETGEKLPMKVADRGIEKVKAGGRMIDARRYDVDSELDASFWYDAQGRWVKTAFEAQGSKIEYVLR
jgi:Family of unknown function (DUF6134)